MFTNTFTISNKFESQLIEVLSFIRTNAANNGFIFNYSVTSGKSFEDKDRIIITIKSNYRLVATYDRRRHCYYDVHGQYLNSVPFDIKSANTNRCYLCNSVRDRNMMKIVRLDDRCIAIGINCYKSIDYDNLVLTKFKTWFTQSDWDSENSTTKSHNYFEVDNIYRFIQDNPNLEYVSIKKAREMRVSSTSVLFIKYNISDVYKSKVSVPNDWLDDVEQFANDLPDNEFNHQLIEIIKDIKMHNSLIHLRAVSLFLYFVFQYRDRTSNNLIPNVADFNGDKVDDNVVLIDFKKTNLVSDYDNKFINKITFKNDQNNVFVWYTTKVLDKRIGKQYHIKTKQFALMKINDHVICKVKNLRGIN